MTNKEIEQAEKELSEIREKKNDFASLIEFFGIYNIPDVGSGSMLSTDERIEKMFNRAHTFLQTKMMLNACNFSKLACKWAAIAAIVASIGVIASWYVFLLKMIFQILKGN
jgi:hypothetical protein